MSYNQFPFSDASVIACLPESLQASIAREEITLREAVQSLDVAKYQLNDINSAIKAMVEYNETHTDSLTDHNVLITDGDKSRYRPYLVKMGIPDKAMADALRDLGEYRLEVEWYTGHIMCGNDEAMACFAFQEHEVQLELSDFSPLQWWHAEHIDRQCFNSWFDATVLAYSATDAMACCQLSQETVNDWLDDWSGRNESADD
jgi:hypothetical protein